LSVLEYDTSQFSEWGHSDCIFGIPVGFLSPNLVVIVKAFGLDNLTTKWGVLELIYFTQLFSLVFGVYCRATGLNSLYRRIFIYESFNSIHRLMLSSFGHTNIFQFIANVPSLMYYSPMLYSVLGDEKFTAFYIISSVLTCFCAVQRNGRHASCSGVVLAMIGILSFCKGPVKFREDLFGFIIQLVLSNQISIGLCLSAVTMVCWIIGTGLVNIGPLSIKNLLKILMRK
jgi:membrane associated rhomboid family serine protease